MFSEPHEAGLLKHAGLADRSEFPPAIPRRVAPQQSPLPLHRSEDFTSAIEPAAIPRQATCLPI
jgi:hypothetical protein